MNYSYRKEKRPGCNFVIFLSEAVIENKTNAEKCMKSNPPNRLSASGLITSTNSHLTPAKKKKQPSFSHLLLEHCC